MFTAKFDCWKIVVSRTWMLNTALNCFQPRNLFCSLILSSVTPHLSTISSRMFSEEFLTGWKWPHQGGDLVGPVAVECLLVMMFPWQQFMAFSWPRRLQLCIENETASRQQKSPNVLVLQWTIWTRWNGTQSQPTERPLMPHHSDHSYWSSAA